MSEKSCYVHTIRQSTSGRKHVYVDCHSVHVAKQVHRSEGFLNGIFDPCTLWARGLDRWKNRRRAVAVAAAAVAVTWTLSQIWACLKIPDIVILQT